ncbi:MAG: metal ABC transporter solute-binding protein, Zn/Mn family [Anaerolineales bacterium]
MHKQGIGRWMVGLMLLLNLFGCGRATSGDEGELTLMVSIMPRKYFVERIGGERVMVNVMVEPGADPHTYEPQPDQMRALSAAAAYSSIGVDFEAVWLDKIAAANKEMRMVDILRDIERRPMAAHHHDEADEHDEHHEHDDESAAEGALDPHVWTSPALVKSQAEVIYEAQAALDPAHQAEYEANLAAFLADIETLERDIHATLENVEHRKLMVFHPSWGYFADDFGLEQIPVEVGGQEPSARELTQVIATAREEQIKMIFAQPEFSTAAAETLAREIDGEVLLITPLAYDWLENMRQVAETFAEAL